MVTLNGCTFTGCSVTVSGQAVLQSTCKEQCICNETLEGLDCTVVFKVSSVFMCELTLLLPFLFLYIVKMQCSKNVIPQFNVK